MKRLSALLILASLCLSCTVVGYARTDNSAQSQARATRKATRKQQKAMNKYIKKQQKAQRKMAKQDRKNTHYPKRTF